MVVESTGEEIHHAYQAEVIQIDEIPEEDTFEADYQQYFAKLEQIYGSDRVRKFKEAALDAWHKLIG